MRSLAVLLLLLLSLALPAGAQDRSIVIDRFHTEIRVHPDARTEFTETLDFEFRGSWNGIERDISLQHRTAEGRRARLALQVTSVTDPSGEPLRYEEERRGGNHRLRIWVPGAEDATRTVVIHYEVPNALRFFSDATHREGGHDELYWNVTGNDWEMPIRRASATISLPPGVHEVAAWAYSGPAGSEAQDAGVEVEGNTIRVVADQPFAPYEGLTVSAIWAPGVVDRSAAAARTGWTDRVAEKWPLVVPVFSFLLGFLLWRRNGREPRRRSITATYEPPAELSPAEAGTLVDHKAEMHDLTATLVDLAVRGYVVIEEVKKPRLFGLFATTDYVFHRARPPEEWGQLAAHEQLYLEGLFSTSSRSAIPAPAGSVFARPGQAMASALAGDTPFTMQTLVESVVPTTARTSSYRASVKLSQLNQRFYKVLERIKDAVYGSLVTRGLYRRRPDSSGAWLVALASAVAMIGLVVTILSLAEALWLDWRLVAGAFAAAVVILLFFSTRMKARTEAGVRALESVLGFREFLSRVESDRFKRMITSPEQFERYLPYAMAFRVENRWARAFESLYTTPPTWYRGSGSGPFRTTSLTRGLNRMSSRASRSMASRPPSKSSGRSGRSGSGGGGRSGGGSGGGGGRGF